MVELRQILAIDRKMQRLVTPATSAAGNWCQVQAGFTVKHDYKHEPIAIATIPEHESVDAPHRWHSAVSRRPRWSTRAGALLVILGLVFPAAKAGDWNGSGTDSIGLYDPSSGRFFLVNAHGGGVANHQFRYGSVSPHLHALAGDWDGDGVDSVGLYNTSSAVFQLNNGHRGGAADIAYRYGPAGSGWIALVGDWNGDGKATAGLYDPGRGVFHLRNSHSPGAAHHSFRYGPVASSMLPLSGDWNGDGIDTVGLYDPATGRFLLKNRHSGGAADLGYRYGPKSAEWAPLTGDWNGDGQDTPGLYDPATGVFHLKSHHAAPFATLAYRFGPAGARWVPMGTSWSPTDTSPDPEQGIMLELVNSARARGEDCGDRGVFGPAPALVWNHKLAAAAQRHSDDMANANLFSHTGSDGSSVADRTIGAGYDWRRVGENIAAGYSSVQAAMSAWLDSDGHCANIMRASFTEFGSARADEINATYKIYWTQVFAAPR